MFSSTFRTTGGRGRVEGSTRSKSKHGRRAYCCRLYYFRCNCPFVCTAVTPPLSDRPLVVALYNIHAHTNTFMYTVCNFYQIFTFLIYYYPGLEGGWLIGSRHEDAHSAWSGEGVSGIKSACGDGGGPLRRLCGNLVNWLRLPTMTVIRRWSFVCKAQVYDRETQLIRRSLSWGGVCVRL